MVERPQEDKNQVSVKSKNKVDAKNFYLSFKYSKGEKELFKLIPQDGKRISSEELTKLRKRNRGWKIGNPRNTVSSQMRSLVAKVAIYEKKFKLCRTPQSGPYSIEYWIEPRATYRRKSSGITSE